MIASPQFISPEEYLQLEAQSAIKHEYRDGEIYAMAGANDAHVTIAGNIFALLRGHVRGTGCRVFISDMKARIEARNCYYYPDVVVTCDPRDQQNETFKQFPRLIVEVLSDSTEAFDRGDKFADYQLLESLEEYVLINTRHQRVECFRRNEAGLWVLQYYTPDTETFHLESLNFTDTISALYEDVVINEGKTE
ncbi:Uma2 family endonuclease [Thermoleptolyngbya sichuanensis XZ-Cy5]|uniref:Uma2 family endonuclease n=1 Tax=Thermoleptolyngbya sichuanensis TaxID=2885951 RepID=UPI00240E25B0|nr:Uma2 family endonuclease [Thermoleptolyngbya sichuanensis]MDG2618076.1 Uma2 family endonuclease [Thermoleptolyngbya sichuanensis XZ-Cy5]